MKLPNYQDYYPYILKFGDERRTADEYLELICEEMKIPEDAKSVRNDSGELTIRNRLRWAIHYLRRANLMDKPERAKYIINSRGKEIRKKYKFDITNKTLEQFEEYKKFIKNSSTVITSKEKIDPIEVLTPSEKIENIITQLNEEAKGELRNQIYDASPYFFEKMVIDLLKKMGYGNYEGTSTTKKSGDGGVDGLVYQDSLGIEIIFIQAKRYATHIPVNREDLEKFVGVLNTKKGAKGVFITTSRFRDSALEYLERTTSKVICIDGEKLMKLLLQYEIGVEKNSTYTTYKVNEDYFSE